jgi:formate dehydrogenase assembly factor FdhD
MVEEAVVRLVAGGIPLFEWRCTPVDLPALVMGRLYIEELSDDLGIAGVLTFERHGDEITIAIPAALRAGEARSVPSERVGVPTADTFAELFKELFARVDAKHASGGMHAAALATNGRIAYQAEDVGRHNAVDKVIGMALLDHGDLTAHGLLVSSRISGEIARKAARSTVAWLASRSIPTTLAVRTAQKVRLPIIGRAAGKHAFIYS